MGWTFYNSNGEALTSFGPVALTDLDIDGGTAIGEAVVGVDLFIMDNGAGGTNVKVTATEVATFIAAPAQANQTAVEAETNQDTYVPPDLLSKAPSSVKAHCSIASGGSLSSGDYNVATIDDDGTGDRTINFTVAFADANYTHIFVNRDNAAVAAGFDTDVKSTGALGYISYNCESNGAADYQQGFAAMGDQ